MVFVEGPDSLQRRLICQVIHTNLTNGNNHDDDDYCDDYEVEILLLIAGRRCSVERIIIKGEQHQAW